MLKQAARRFFLIVAMVSIGFSAAAAPYAALVMDARTGKVLYSRNADTRLHPASLTKMMTLYVTFEAIRNGEISLDTMVTVSKNAAAEPPSKLGLRAGQRIKLKYLIRAAAVKSANDCATAIGEAVGGSEAAFARRMNKTAKALGMTRSTFKNANGLTRRGHMSTARDMTIMGRHLLYDFPEYYNLFSRIKTEAGKKEVYNTNRKFLRAYDGADGIKTGYTAASGFNLVASAERGDERIIATIFGGRSTAMRNKKMAELLNLGFKRAPKHVKMKLPVPPSYAEIKPDLPVAAVRKSPRPKMRDSALAQTDNAQVEKAISAAIVAAVDPKPRPAINDSKVAVEAVADTAIAAVIEAPRPMHRSDEPVVVTKMSTSGGRDWSIDVGGFNTRTAAEKMLLSTALRDFGALDGAVRKVVPRAGKFHASFIGLTEVLANRACSRLRAARQECVAAGPNG